MNLLTLKLQPNFKMILKGMITFVATILMLGFANSVFATDSVDLSPVQPITEQSSTDYSNSNEIFYETGELPAVEIEQAANFISGKLGDVIKFLQLIIKPLCVLMAALCLGMSVFGIFGDSGLLTRGLVGLFFTALCYFGVMHAPELVGFINSWMSQGTEFLG